MLEIIGDNMKLKEEDWFYISIVAVVMIASIGTAVYGLWTAACLAAINCH